NTANDGINIHAYDIDKKPLKWNTINTYNYYITDANEKLITTPSNCRYIRFRTEDNRVLNSNVVIISSNTITGNEKPQLDKKQILTTLRSLPNGVKDTIEKRGNKYYKIKRCGEVTLNGSESWVLNANHIEVNTTRFSLLTTLNIKMIV